MSRNKIIGIILCFLGIASFIGLILINNSKGRQSKICFQRSCFNVELALTAKKQTNGLMFRKHLDKNSGMLFIFKEEKKYPFWMKNTLIPLDIIWIDKDKKIVFMSKNAQPCEKNPCPTFHPDKKAKYVLELNAGTANRIGLQISNQALLKY